MPRHSPFMRFGEAGARVIPCGIPKTVRILFNDGTSITHNGIRTIDVGGDLVILSAPGLLYHCRAHRTEVHGTLIAPGVRHVWVGRI